MVIKNQVITVLSKYSTMVLDNDGTVLTAQVKERIMLSIVGKLTKTRVEHTEPALPASVPVPSRREAIEALGIIQKLTKEGMKSVLMDNEVVTIDNAFETLRRFVVTR